VVFIGVIDTFETVDTLLGDVDIAVKLIEGNIPK
jgi:hypothetical protein